MVGVDGAERCKLYTEYEPRETEAGDGLLTRRTRCNAERREDQKVLYVDGYRTYICVLELINN